MTNQSAKAEALEIIQSTFFNLCDLIESGCIDDITLEGVDGFEGYDSVLEFIRDQCNQLEQAETNLELI